MSGLKPKRRAVSKDMMLTSEPVSGHALMLILLPPVSNVIGNTFRRREITSVVRVLGCTFVSIVFDLERSVRARFGLG